MTVSVTKFSILMSTILLFATSSLSLQVIAQDIDIFEQAKLNASNLSTALETCYEENAITVEFNELFDPRLEPFQANPNLLYKCVKVEGITSWRRVFKDTESIYQIVQFGAYQANTHVREHIGLSRHEKMRSENLHEAAKKGTLIGVLATCGFTMGGYCHYEEGPHLVLKTLNGEIIDRGFRYIGKAAEDKFGNLTLLSDDASDKIELSNLFEKWADAITNKDRKSFEWVVSLSDYEGSQYTQYDKHLIAQSADEIYSHYRGLWEAFFDNNSVYNKLIDRRHKQRKIFKVDFKSLPEPIDLTFFNSDYIVCQCLKDDCTGKWPISSRDAGAHKSYPYVCKSFWKNDEGKWKSRLPLETTNSDIIQEKLYKP